jgi:hypothetical protein
MTPISIWCNEYMTSNAASNGVKDLGMLFPLESRRAVRVVQVDERMVWRRMYSGNPRPN